MSARLNGRIAVVTGAGSGIGEAIVERFHQEGASIVAVDISGKQNELAARLGERCYPFQADVANEAEVAAAMQEAVKRFGGLDIACNNAGIEGPPLATTDEYDVGGFDRIMSINARGIFLGMRYAIPLMLERGGGAIVNTASVASLVAFPRMIGYCATKGAVQAMTRTTAAEFADRNIRVNCVCPGPIMTAMLAAMPREHIAAVEAGIPMKRTGQPSEVADSVLFLASDEASYITGHSLVMDGGYTAM